MVVFVKFPTFVEIANNGEELSGTFPASRSTELEGKRMDSNRDLFGKEFGTLWVILLLSSGRIDARVGKQTSIRCACLLVLFFHWQYHSWDYIALGILHGLAWGILLEVMALIGAVSARSESTTRVRGIL